MLAGYGEGEFISGDLGFSNITIGSIHVPKQEVALVNQAYWEGDGITSGLLGLAYSTITSAYIGTNSMSHFLSIFARQDSEQPSNNNCVNSNNRQCHRNWHSPRG